jgi:hypothetical protein
LTSPFKFIEWNEPFDFYTKQLQNFIKTTGFIEKGTFFNPVGAARLYDAIPEFEELFHRHNLEDFQALAVIRALPASVAPNFPHTDIMPSPDQKIAINWPVFNCDETYTCFYEKKPNAQPNVVKLPNGLPYSKYDYDSVIETHRIKLDKPVALRYDVLHAVENNTDRVRITASFRFKTNHWELLNG